MDTAAPGLVEAVMEQGEVAGKDRQRALDLCLRSLVQVLERRAQRQQDPILQVLVDMGELFLPLSSVRCSSSSLNICIRISSGPFAHLFPLLEPFFHVRT